MARLLPADPSGIASAAAHLRAGGLVAFPTETVYGLGASARDLAAVEKVFTAKSRPADHPLIVHLPDAGQLWAWADPASLSAEARKVAAELAAAFWPGPLTLVLPARDDVPRAVTGGQDTVALRVPADQVAAALLRAFGGAVVAPSANRFGRVSPTDARHVLAEFPAEDEIVVLDGGRTRHGLESTILDLSRGPARLLRPGALPAHEISAVVPVIGPGPEAPRAPGTLPRHYAPTTPLRQVSTEDLERGVGASTGVIARRPPAGAVPHAPFRGSKPPPAEARWLVLPSDPAGFAHELYAAVRHLDALGLREVLVERPEDAPAWLAVRDRLDRATAEGGDGARGAAGSDAPLVAVVMGSASDWETMRHADEVLSSFRVPHVCKVVSAHRTPDRMAAFARGAEDRGIQVIVAGAGGAAHLPGMIAAQTHLPVLGVPVRSSALSGMDSLLSVVQMPRGVPVGTLAIGEAGAVNAALMAVAILALTRPELRDRLVAYRQEQTAAAERSTLPSPSFEP
ncbi:MAG TPA: 5-(carboxyamino)imidazole ribonucleotide mutase [Trueperaceae bacterium]